MGTLLVSKVREETVVSKSHSGLQEIEFFTLPGDSVVVINYNRIRDQGAQRASSRPDCGHAGCLFATRSVACEFVEELGSR